MLIKCKECGNEISDKSNKCPHCGCQNNYDIGGIETITKPVVEAEQVESKKKNRNVKKKTRIMNKKAIIIVTAIIVIIVLFGILVGTHTICLKHEYSEATVLEPQTCWHCGKIKGEPRELEKIEFPTQGVGSLLPLPESNMGEIIWETSGSFECYVGNTTISEFNQYIKDCAEKGFNIDYYKDNDYYSAKDSMGNDLDLYYKGNNIMYIYLYATDVESDEKTSNCDTNGHKENDWVTVKEATESEVGEKQKVCTVCNEILKSEKVYYYEITEDEAMFYTNVLDIYNSIAEIHISPETFKLLGAVSTDSRVTICLEYAGTDGSAYTDYFWKDIDDDAITNKYGKENYTGFAQAVNTLDVAEILYYEKSGDYVPTISDDVVVDY